MIVETFAPEHLHGMSLQREQDYLREFVTPAYLQTLAGGEAAQAIRIDGHVVACFGVGMVPAIGRMLWCFFDKNAGKHFIRLHRFATGFVHAYERRRLHATAEPRMSMLHATVEIGFEPGQRWLQMLGFTFVDVLEHYGPDARNHLLFVKL